VIQNGILNLQASSEPCGNVGL